MDLPNPKHFFEVWNTLAIENGLNGIHFVGLKGGPLSEYRKPLDAGYKAVCWENFYSAELKASWQKTYLFPKIHRFYSSRWVLKKYQYKDIINHFFTDIDRQERVYPSIVSNYDRSPRGGGNKAVVFYGSTSDLFKNHVSEALDVIRDKSDEHKLLFLRSWNEWGEGNYIEPDEEFGRQYLDVLHDLL
jgi:hypothetical protein